MLQEQCGTYGYSLVMVAVDGEVTGAIELHPKIRPEAKQIVSQLGKSNMKSGCVRIFAWGIHCGH